MLNSVLALLDTRTCTRSPGHDLRNDFAVATVSTRRSRDTAGLAPLWNAIGCWTPELERHADGWFEMSGATALDDVVKYGLTEPFLDHLGLKQMPRLKASKYLRAHVKSRQEKDSSHSLSVPRSEQVSGLDLRNAWPKKTSQEAEYKKQPLWLGRPGMPPTAGRSRSRLRRGRSSRQSANTGRRVSFSVDTKGGSGCPGDASPPSNGRTNRIMNQHHRPHSTPAPPSEAFGQASLALAPHWRFTQQTLPVPRGDLRIQAQSPSSPYVRMQTCTTSALKPVPQPWVDDDTFGAAWLDWMPPWVRL